MSIKELQKMGAFVKPETVKRSVTWNGHTFDIFIKKMNAGEHESMFRQMGAEQSSNASLISQCLFENEAGEVPLMSYDQAFQLAPSLSGVFIGAITEELKPKN